jgi:hypothetical protein
MTVLTAATLIAGAYNAWALVSLERPLWVAWGIVFGVAVPVLVCVQAWRLVTNTPAPMERRNHPALLLLTITAVFEGAMVPMAERIVETVDCPARQS